MTDVRTHAQWICGLASVLTLLVLGGSSAGTAGCGDQPTNFPPLDSGVSNCPNGVGGCSTTSGGTGGSSTSSTSSTSSGGCAGVDTSTNLLNCGSCGHKCGEGTTCAAGVCLCAGMACEGTCCADTSKTNSPITCFPWNAGNNQATNICCMGGVRKHCEEGCGGCFVAGTCTVPNACVQNQVSGAAECAVISAAMNGITSPPVCSFTASTTCVLPSSSCM